MAGFAYDVSKDTGNGWKTIHQNASTETLITAIRNGFIVEMYPLQNCISIVCNFLTFKLFNPQTIWACETYPSDRYVIYYAYDNYSVQYLTDNLRSGNIQANYIYPLAFTNNKIISLSKNWQDYHVNTLPKLTDSDCERLLEIDRLISSNKGYHFQINPIVNDNYNIPQIICKRLANSVISLNTQIVLERVLQVACHSSAILDNSELWQPYKFDFNKFCKPLLFKGKHGIKTDITQKALDDLIEKGFINSYGFDDNNNLIFVSGLITKNIRQHAFKRNLGYYANLSANKPYIATFLNYISYVRNCKYENLTIALDTLFIKLGLERLLQKSRNAEMAKILNELRQIGQEYKLLISNEQVEPITSNDIKYLRKNRDKTLRKFIQLFPLPNDKEKRQGDKIGRMRGLK